MICIIIKNWDAEKSWAKCTGWHKERLADYLSKNALNSNTEAKRLSRKILGKEVNEINLPNLSSIDAAEYIVQMLESLGAEVEVIEKT